MNRMSYKITFFTFLFFFAIVNFSAQEKVNIDDVESRYVYLLKYQIDSLDKSSSSEEYFILERGKEKSQFMGVTSYNRDSLAGGANRFAFGLDPKVYLKPTLLFESLKTLKKTIFLIMIILLRTILFTKKSLILTGRLPVKQKK
jgi:hypothetical protein